MRKLNQLRVTFEKGKETNRKVIAEGKKVVDNVADDLVMQSKIDLKEAAQSEKIKIITIWEDKGEIKRAAKKPAKK